MAENVTIDDIIKALRDATPSDRARVKKALGSDSGDERQRTRTSRDRRESAGDISRLMPDVKQFAEEGVESVLGEIGKIQGAYRSLTDEIKENRTQSEEFFKAGFDKQFRENLSSAIGAASDMSFKLNGNLKSSRIAIDGLRDGFSGFMLSDKAMQNSVARTATAFVSAGANASDFASIVDSATFGFGQSKGQIEDMSAALMATSRQFAISPKKMLKDFDFFQKNFAYSADKTMDVFVKLQQMSRTTGVGFDALAKSFGNNMDRFDSSAQMAGKLNQILGKSMFNSIDLLNKSEEERARTIREGILSRFGDNVSNMQKFELKAVAESLNMSVDDARKFLSGGGKELTDKLDEMKGKSPAEIQAQSLGDELGKLDQGIRSFRRPTENAFLDINVAAREGAKSVKQFRNGVDDVANSLSNKLLKTINMVSERSGITEQNTLNFEKIAQSAAKTAAKLVTGENPLITGPLNEATKKIQNAVKTFVEAFGSDISAPGGSVDRTRGGRQPIAPLSPITLKAPQVNTRANNAIVNSNAVNIIVKADSGTIATLTGKTTEGAPSGEYSANS